MRSELANPVQDDRLSYRHYDQPWPNRASVAGLMDRWIESVMIYPNGTDGAEGGYCCAGIGYGC